MMWSRSEGVDANEILERFARDDEHGQAPPSRRQVERWIDDAAGQGPAWSLVAESDPEAAAIILGALAQITWARAAIGQLATMTTDDAFWTVRIARAAPGLGPFWAYRVGILYRDRVMRGQETRALDVYLGSAPWADDKRYLSIIENGGVEEWFGEGWNPPLALVLRRHYGQ